VAGSMADAADGNRIATVICYVSFLYS